MKFTNGYWHVRKEITPLYAVEYGDSKAEAGALTVFAPGRHITDRGDCLNCGMLTIVLSSPMDDVIKVSITHFKGAAPKGPYADYITRQLFHIRRASPCFAPCLWNFTRTGLVKS